MHYINDQRIRNLYKSQLDVQIKQWRYFNSYVQRDSVLLVILKGKVNLFYACLGFREPEKSEDHPLNTILA